MERKQEIIEAIKSGQSYSSIGKQFKVSKQRVGQIASEAGIRRRLSVAPEVAKPTSMVDRIIKWVRG